MDKENVVYTYNGILFSHKKGGKPALCDNRDRPGHYAKCKKPNAERQILHDFTYIWNLK